MAVAELADSGRIAISTEFAEKDLIRMVPGTRWDPQGKVWHAPLSWGSCKALRGVFRNRLTVGPMLNQWAWDERQRWIEPALQLRTATEAAGDERLFPFQRAGVDWLATVEQGLLADEMGTGKTLQTQMAIRRLYEHNMDSFPVCVISPNSVKTVWEDEWAKWDPAVTVLVVRGSAAKRRKVFDDAAKAIARGDQVAVVINIEAVRIHSRLAPYGSIRLADAEKQAKELNLLGFRTVIVDEAHRMKDPRAKQTRGIWAVQHGEQVRYRFALTGTPIANQPGELWSILHGISPGDFPTKTAYIDRYCMQSWNPFGGLDIIGVRPDTADEFHAIVGPRLRRMPKELVLPFLPDKYRSIRYCEMGTKQAKAYREIDEQLVTRLEDGSLVLTTNNLARNTRLLQFASAYAIVDEAGDVKLSEPSPKIDSLLELLGDLDPTDHVVVAAESRQLIELAATRLEKEGITFRLIVGGMTEEQRKQSVDDFQNGHARCMLMTLKAGGVGITLTRASTIVFLQRSWSMIDNKQGEDRVHRIGSEIHDKILVIDMVTVGTIEETQIPRLHQKLTRLQEIVRDKEVLASRVREIAAVYQTGQATEEQIAEWRRLSDLIASMEGELESIEQTPLWTTDNAQEVTPA